jgi:hypothetical protein
VAVDGNRHDQAIREVHFAHAVEQRLQGLLCRESFRQPLMVKGYDHAGLQPGLYRDCGAGR